MRYRGLFVLLLTLFTYTGWAQCNPKEYKRIFAEAVGLQKKGAFIEAKNTYEAAKIFACNQKEKDAADEAVDALFEQINRLREQADSTALTAYANDLAYKSTIALRDGDRTTAFRLAEFAHRYVDNDNLNVTIALVQALYYNENPAHTPLPWASTLSGHTDKVRSVAFSPDGKKIAIGTDDGIAKIWDMEHGKVILTLNGNTGYVYSVVFSSDGKKLATVSGDLFKNNILKIWDLQHGKDILTLDGHDNNVNSVAFPPDGKKIATDCIDNTAKIWDLQQGKVILTLSGHDDNVNSVAFSPDGKKLATGSRDKTAKIWDLEHDKDILTLSGHTASVNSVAFSPDGKKIATGSDDKTAKIWDLTPEGWMASMGHSKRLSGLSSTQLDAYNLSSLLDLRPQNETLLLQTKDTWQIAAFAELYTDKITRTGLPKKADYERASRLYRACLESDVDNGYFEKKMADLEAVWKEKTE